jgi:hypothetical protein
MRTRIGVADEQPPDVDERLQGELGGWHVVRPAACVAQRLPTAQVPGEAGQPAVAHDERGEVVRFSGVNQRIRAACRRGLGEVAHPVDPLVQGAAGWLGARDQGEPLRGQRRQAAAILVLRDRRRFRFTGSSRPMRRWRRPCR